jgi:hypothetical protein
VSETVPKVEGKRGLGEEKQTTKYGGSHAKITDGGRFQQANAVCL